jgi:hypothetical protein
MRFTKRRFQVSYLMAVLAFGFSAFGLCGCDDEDVVSSVQPHFMPQDVTTDVDLSGTWEYEEEVQFTFTPGEQDAYDVVVEEQEDDRHYTSHFAGHLFPLGGDSFLDLYPTKIPEGSEFYYMHFFPCHTVAKIEFPGGDMQMTFLSASWLSKQIKAGTISIPHAAANGTLLLTATTQELQEVLFMNASNEEAFHDPIRFERPRNKEPQ